MKIARFIQGINKLEVRGKELPSDSRDPVKPPHSHDSPANCDLAYSCTESTNYIKVIEDGANSAPEIAA